jgi:hypothetical protein
MRESFRFRDGKLHGEIKPASPHDNPGELMIIGMPLVANVDMSSRGGKRVTCPLCGQACWATPPMLQGLAMYPGRSILACTQCSLRANLNKGHVPRWMEHHGYTPQDLIQPIVSLFS